MAFNTQAALKAGYSQEEINAYLTSKKGGTTTTTRSIAPTATTGTSTTDYNTSIESLTQAATQDLQTTGGKNITKINSLLDIYKKKQELVAGGGMTPDQIEAQEKKSLAEKSKQQAISLVDDLLQRDTGAITGLKNPLKLATGEYQQTKAIYDQLISSLSLESRQKLKGQGQISDYEFKVLEKASSALRQNLSNDAFEEELLKVKGILSGAPVEKRKKKDKGLIDMFYGNTKKIVQDVGSGLGQNMEPGTQVAQDQALTATQQLMDKAMQMESTDPEGAKRLRKLAGESLKVLRGESQKKADAFSEDVKVNPLQRGVLSAAEIAGTAELPALASATKVALKGGPKSLLSSKVFPGSKASLEVAKKQAKVKFAGDDFVKEINKYVADDPLAKPIADKLIPSLKGKMFTAEEVLNKLPVWNKAFSAAGKVGKSSKAGVYTTLSRAARDQMAEKSPELFKAYSKWAKGLALKNFGQSVAGQVPRAVLTGTAIAGGTSLINKFIKPSQNP